MVDNPLNSMKGIFSRNPNMINDNNKKITKPKKTQRNQQEINLNDNASFNNMGVHKPNKINPADFSNPYQRELSEMDKILLKHMKSIEKEIGKLVVDVQDLDSKNPIVSSNMNKMLVELINNIWTIGNIITNYREHNQLDIVTQFLSKHEKRLLKIMEDPKKDSPHITDELNEIRLCQRIINDSIRPINSSAEYYNILMSKLSNWGFEVKNPVGQKYNVHMDIDVLAFDGPDSNLKVHMITETKKPEIYLNGDKLAKAQVIVTKSGSKINKIEN